MRTISLRRIEKGICLLGATLVVAPIAFARAQKAPDNLAAQRIALPHSVPNIVRRATLLKHLEPQQKAGAIVAFRFRDPQAAQAYADAVSQPNSPLFRQFLTPQEVAERFGPNPADYQAVKAFAAENGLRVAQEYPNRMTITLEGTVAQVEKAFGTTINLYRESRADFLKRPHRGKEPMVFRSNATPLQIPAAFASAVSGVLGVNDAMRPIPNSRRSRKTTGPFTPAQIRSAYDLNPIYGAGNTGTGRTIAISNYDGVNVAQNGPLYISAFSLPVPAGGATSNIKTQTYGGGNGTDGFGEGDLDFQAVLGMAPLASIIIYDVGSNAPVTDQLLTALQSEANDNKADIISDSYTWAYDGMTETAPYHAIHLTMSMQGQTYCAAAGDNGSAVDPNWYSCVDPDVLVVGGTVLALTASSAWSSETAWGGTLDGSPYGSSGGWDPSGYFSPPSYQKGRGVGFYNGRAFPDISFFAASQNLNDPGAIKIFYSGSEITFDGTSVATPLAAGCLAITEQYMIGLGKLPPTGSVFTAKRLGRFNDALYAFNGRNDVFHDITVGNNSGYSCTAYWDLVTGWGSIDFYNMAYAYGLPAPTVTVTPKTATIPAGTTVQCAAAVTGTAVTTINWTVLSGPGSVSATGLYTAPINVSATTQAVVQGATTIDYAAAGASAGTTIGGTSTITINPVGGYMVSGTVTLTGCLNNVQPINFTFVNSANTAFTATATLSSTGAYSLTNIPNGTYTVKVKGAKWLQTDVSGVVVNGANIAGVNATLLPGDLNNDNVIDLNDFSLFVQSFGYATGDALFNPNADLNCDGQVDINDFSLLAEYFGDSGAP